MRDELRRTSSYALLLAALALAPPARAAAQTEGVEATRSLLDCIDAERAQLERIVALIEEAEDRAASGDTRLSRDARESIPVLVGRAHDVRERLRLCVEHARIPAPGSAEVRHEPEVDAAADSVAGTSGTVHVVESDASLGEHVRIVRGERVDGTGTAPDSAVRAGVHAVGSRLGRCYDAYVDRVGRTHGQIVVSFTIAGSGRSTEVAIERDGHFDAGLRECVTRAVRDVRVRDASGTTVFSYTFALGAE